MKAKTLIIALTIRGLIAAGGFGLYSLGMNQGR